MEQELIAELDVLQDYLDSMLIRLNQNSVTLKRLQHYEMRLLSLNSLAEIIEFILEQSKILFELDCISLCLVDSKAEIAQYLEFDHYEYKERQSLILIGEDQIINGEFKIPIPAFLGAYETENCERFFPLLLKKPASVMIIPLMRRGICMGSFNLGSFKIERFSQTMATDFIQHIASVISICLENSIIFETMRRSSMLDALTGVHNRRFLEQRLEEELERCQRTREPLSCLFMDIDFFKRVNDLYGHQAGDFVLSQVAQSIKKQLRSSDVLSRYGGEEFVSLLLHSDSKTAQEVAERIRANIADLMLEYANQTLKVTISIGVATYQTDGLKKIAGLDIGMQLIQAADTALYVAKNNGRNRIVNGGFVII